MTPTPTQTPTRTPTPGNFSDVFEDNDDPCQATSTLAGSRYTTQIDDSYDFFELQVTQTGTLALSVTNHANAGQLDLRSPLTDSNCSATTSTRQLAYQFIVNDAANINYLVTPGTYYARIYIASVPNPAKSYNFQWSLTPGSMPAAVCVGDVSNKTCFGDAPGGTVPVWWQGLNGNARVRLQFSAMTAKGCPTPSRQPTMEFITNLINGNRTLSAADNIDWRLDQGAYKVVIYAWDVTSGAELYKNTNGQAVKVDCQFSRPADEQELPSPTPAP